MPDGWWALAVSTVGRPAAPGLGPLGLLVVVALLTGCARRLRDRPVQLPAERRPGDRWRVYGRVDAAQALAIPAVAVVGGATGHPALISPRIPGVVEPHFLPLARAFRWRGYLAQGAGLLVVCGVGLAPVAGGASAGTGRLVTAAGAADVLRAGVPALLVTATRHRPEPAGR